MVIVVIWVEHLRTEISMEMSFYGLVRAIGKVLFGKIG